MFNWNLKSWKDEIEKLEENVLLNCPLGETFHTFQHVDKFSLAIGQPHFSNSFLISQIQKSKRIVLDDLLHKDVKKLAEVFRGYGEGVQTEKNLYQKPALAILKHRGSKYDKGIFPYQITGRGFEITNEISEK